MFDYVVSLGFNNKLISLESIAKVQGFQVHDPINYTKEFFDFEIVKYLLLSSIVIESALGSKTVLGLLPRHPDSISKTLDSITAYVSEGYTVLHTGLKYRSDFKQLAGNKCSINSFSAEWSAELLIQETNLIDFEYEAYSPSKILLSNNWRKNVKNLSDSRNLVLATSPMSKSQGTPNSDSILGLLGATRIVIV
jgi:hypothetical protein